MRLVNPEWEAIKEFEHHAKMRDVQFDLIGLELPEDHAHVLFEALAEHLPWLRDTAEVGVHPIHGASNGMGALVINRRIKLVLRLPLNRLTEAHTLVGKSIDLGCGPLIIGDLHEKPLTPFSYLYSHFVSLGERDEIIFMKAARHQLDEMGIECGLIPGKHRKMDSPDGEISGYSLMLHDVSLAQSIIMQEQGLGLHRNHGCGIFIPHKSIKEVTLS